MSEDSINIKFNLNIDNPLTLLAMDPPKIEKIFTECEVILDSSVLLFPYDMAKSSHKGLDFLTKLLENLFKKSLLFTTEHNLREFLTNRNKKIEGLIEAISKVIDEVNIKEINIPLITFSSEYSKAREDLKEFAALQKTYKSSLSLVKDEVIRWPNGNDPISIIYRNIFNESNVIKPTSDIYENLENELNFRKENNIPPGYKDDKKLTNKFGDLIVWKTILNSHNARKSHVIFVTQDTKEDWFHKSGGIPIARRELAEEYFKASSGKHIYIMTLSQFLSLSDIDNTELEEIKSDEKTTYQNLDTTDTKINALEKSAIKNTEENLNTYRESNTKIPDQENAFYTLSNSGLGNSIDYEKLSKFINEQKNANDHIKKILDNFDAIEKLNNPSPAPPDYQLIVSALKKTNDHEEIIKNILRSNPTLKKPKP